MSWYLRKADQTIYGPVSFDILRRWAADGRIVSEDHVSEDEVTWRPAPDLASLEMDWFIDLPEGQSYGPLHLMALAELVRDGTIVAANRVTHRPTGLSHALCDVLLPPLAEHAAALQDALDARAAPAPASDEGPARYEAERAARARAEEALAEQARQHEERVQDLQGRLAGLEAKAADGAAWQARYEAEHAARTRAENEKAGQDRERDAREQALRGQVEELEARVRAAEAAPPPSPAPIGGPSLAGVDVASLRQSYNDLNRNYERLLEQLRDKQEELKAAVAQRAQAEANLQDKTFAMDDNLAQARAEADDLRERLAKIEQTHADIVRAYRELNDRHIRLRQQTEGQQAPATGDAAAPPKGGRPDKPKVRLV